MFRNDPAHTGISSYTVSPPLNLLWNYTTGFLVPSSPAVSGGVVYVGSLDQTNPVKFQTYQRFRKDFSSFEEFVDWYNNRPHGSLNFNCLETPEIAFWKK